MNEQFITSVCNYARKTVIIYPLPISSECGGRDISDGCQVEGLRSNWGADTDEVTLSSKKHGNETGFVHSSWSMDQEYVITVWYITFLEGSLEDFSVGTAKESM